MRYVFLTGAGASYGAGKLVPKPPPLGKYLFKELACRFSHSWGSLPNKYAMLLSKDFELGMESVWTHRLDLVQRMMIDEAIYFSEFNPSLDNSDCYSRLVAAIVKERLVQDVAFATLNYDCVLDVAVCRNRLKVAYAGLPPTTNNILIWKLHGACNLLPAAHVYNMTIAAKSIFDGPIEPVDLPLVRKRYKGGLAIPPVMSVYMPEKPTQTVSRFLVQVRNEWAKWVGETDIVIVIGVRPLLAEEYIWQPILDSSAKVWYIGGKDGDYRQFRDYLGARLTYVTSTFEEGIGQLIAGIRTM